MALPGTDTEFTFELRCCRWAERNWPPGEASATPVVVARQLGTRRRRWDTVVLEVDPEALARRARFGERRLDSDLLHVVRNAPAEWSWYRDALPHPGYPWKYVREAVHRAADRGVVETRRDGNRIQLRRKWRYPDWVERIVAVENKPDLNASAARDLREQLQRDVALALADEVWVATAATGESVEPIVLRDLPVETGQLAVDPTTGRAEVTWRPAALAVDEPGTRILERPSGGQRTADSRASSERRPAAGEYDRSAARFEYVAPETKAEKRLEIAERAYERGWRSYVDTMRPDCRHFELRRDGRGLLPWCAAKERVPTARECAGGCSEFEPEPPAWRQRDWPLDGGPGAALRRLLDRRRERARPE